MKIYSQPIVCCLLAELDVTVILRLEAGRGLVILSWRAPEAASAETKLLILGLEPVGEAAHPQGLLPHIGARQSQEEQEQRPALELHSDNTALTVAVYVKRCLSH